MQGDHVPKGSAYKLARLAKVVNREGRCNSHALVSTATTITAAAAVSSAISAAKATIATVANIPKAFIRRRVEHMVGIPPVMLLREPGFAAAVLAPPFVPGTPDAQE